MLIFFPSLAAHVTTEAGGRLPGREDVLASLIKWPLVWGMQTGWPQHTNTHLSHTQPAPFNCLNVNAIMSSDLRMIACYCPALGWRDDGKWWMTEWANSEGQRRSLLFAAGGWSGAAQVQRVSVRLCSCVVRLCDGCWKVGRVSGMWWVLNDGFGGLISHGHGFSSPWATEDLLGRDAVLTFCRKFTISLGVFLISQFIYKSISLSLWWHTHWSLTDHRMLVALKKKQSFLKMVSKNIRLWLLVTSLCMESQQLFIITSVAFISINCCFVAPWCYHSIIKLLYLEV